MNADGGTNINDALTEAFRIDSPDDRMPIVLFLTDGLPTVGVQDAAQIARNIARERGSARVFSFGVGYGYNNTDQLTQITYPSGRVVDYARGDLQVRELVIDGLIQGGIDADRPAVAPTEPASTSQSST